jgi:hypothetical protein
MLEMEPSLLRPRSRSKNMMRVRQKAQSSLSCSLLACWGTSATSHCLPLLSTPSHVLTMTRQIANHVDCRTRSRHCECILSVISTIRGLINAALSLVARHEQSNDCYCMGCRTAFWDHRTTLCWGYERQLSNQMGQTKAVHDWRSSFIHRLRHAVRLGGEDRHMFPDGREC